MGRQKQQAHRSSKHPTLIKIVQQPVKEEPKLSSPQLARPTTSDRAAWRTYWQTQNQHWRTEPEISPERQKFLHEHCTIVSNFEHSFFPFKDVKLTRADIEWLLATDQDETGLANRGYIDQQKTGNIDLRGADLRGVDLGHLPLMGIRGGLDWREWNEATTEQREAAAIHLEGANLSQSDLQKAILRGAHLERAILYGAHLEGAYLYKAHLEGTVLCQAFFDNTTQLGKVFLGNKVLGFALLVDVHWNDVNLTAVNWEGVSKLGDEEPKTYWQDWGFGKAHSKDRQIDVYKRAVRAYLQLANVLEEQGLNEEAARFTYRAKVLQRRVLRLYLFQQQMNLSKRMRTLTSYLFSHFLDWLAGYGYRPRRSLFWYFFVIASFAVGYYEVTHLLHTQPRPLAWYEALILSISSFHGRGFFQPIQNLGDPVAILASIEAIVGLIIEISFIATFTQRYFGK